MSRLSKRKPPYHQIRMLAVVLLGFTGCTPSTDAALKGAGDQIVEGKLEPSRYSPAGFIRPMNKQGLGVGDIYCGQGLIDHDLAVTAEHCLISDFARGFSIGFGSLADATGALEQRPSYPVKFALNRSDRGDIAVLVLERSVEGIVPAKLAAPAYDDPGTEAIDCDHYLIAYGANTSDGKRDMQRRGTPMCVSRDESALNAYGQGGVCSGDSGSALFVRDERDRNPHSLVGIVSSIDRLEGCVPGNQVGFMYVIDHANFLNAATAIRDLCAEREIQDAVSRRWVCGSFLDVWQENSGTYGAAISNPYLRRRDGTDNYTIVQDFERARLTAYATTSYAVAVNRVVGCTKAKRSGQFNVCSPFLELYSNNSPWNENRFGATVTRCARPT